MESAVSEVTSEHVATANVLQQTNAVDTCCSTVVVSCAARPTKAELEQGRPRVLEEVDERGNIVASGGTTIIRRVVRGLVDVGLLKVILILGFGEKQIHENVSSDRELEGKCEINFTLLGEDCQTGFAPSLLAAQGVVPAGESFIISTSDHLFSSKVINSMRTWKMPGNESYGIPRGVLVLVDTTANIVNSPEFQGSTMVKVQCDGNRVVQIGATTMGDDGVEWSPDGIEAGLFLCSPSFFEDLEKWRHDYFTMANALAHIAKRGLVFCHQIKRSDEWWSWERKTKGQAASPAQENTAVIHAEKEATLASKQPWEQHEFDEKKLADLSLLIRNGSNSAQTATHLGGNSLGVDSIIILCALLRESGVLREHPTFSGITIGRTLTGLNLEMNRIGTEGARHIASLLSQNNTLRTIKLGKNDFGEEGARSMGDALASNTTLTHLTLGGNAIGSPGAVALAAGLAQNTSLHTLRIGGNDVGDAGAEAMAQMLRQNRLLTCLHMYGNTINQDGIEALLRTLQWGNANIVTLNLGGNPCGSNPLLAELKHITTINASAAFRIRLMLIMLLVVESQSSQQRVDGSAFEGWGAFSCKGSADTASLLVQGLREVFMQGGPPA